MSAQRKAYLRLADKATNPRNRLFYRLMADIAPLVSTMARQNVNQHGASIVYEVVMRVAAASVCETAFNLGGGVADLEALKSDFAKVLEETAASQQALAPVPCTPKMDA